MASFQSADGKVIVLCSSCCCWELCKSVCYGLVTINKSTLFSFPASCVTVSMEIINLKLWSKVNCNEVVNISTPGGTSAVAQRLQVGRVNYGEYLHLTELNHQKPVLTSCCLIKASMSGFNASQPPLWNLISAWGEQL